MDPERSGSAAFEIGESNEEVVSRTVMSPARIPQKRQQQHVDITVRQGRALAVHAFLHGAQCGDRRVGELLGVCRRTAGRDRARAPMTTPPILERAQALVAASADRGSTPQERAAAAAWLNESHGSSTPVEVPMVPEFQEAPSHEVATPIHVAASLTRDQVDACGRLHRRIRIRTDAIRRLLEPETGRDDLIEIILDLFGEIRGATDALETLLQDARPGHAPAV